MAEEEDVVDTWAAVEEVEAGKSALVLFYLMNSRDLIKCW